eukprot:8516771-Karenia_brevis.AAC.1
MKQIQKHRKLVLGYFVFEENSKELTVNGDREEKIEDWELQLLGKQEAIAYRRVAARLHFTSLDCADIQCPVKQSSKDMANPT